MTIRDRFKNIFEPELLSQIESRSEIKLIPEGGIILDIGQSVRIVPLLLKGVLKISRVDDSGREILLYYVHANESCAMTFTCCMQQHPSEIKATAESEVELLAIPIGVMDEWLSKYPTWKSFVMRTIRNRFNELLGTIDQLAFQKLDERLVTYLKEKSRATGSTLINLSHEDIAGELASSREVISRLLKKLENDNKVLLFRNQIKILRDL
ncbi:MAG: Crp/Fnr family transcriptional regulator [Saprospiraceae bacterium]|jgi:CRP/FNR family transcriptional regulator|nr:Crp/Fnr family transcriptional regulator [Saprospiraceae bacterium]MBX7179073.1 Crp/Fnr family transcriptional regulator [Saprospiraceae bacterium]MCB0590144.1 Crp/Fnr family transcriptional regulator [Saprospiraceae bacterium]MCC7147636.1 Crp/Fnr family transcriptional regulator [Saprospiraceae bacterium]MCO5284075.1 Crp/Fnr family transcriptional regulator [Saprospiraceae bacterium]